VTSATTRQRPTTDRRQRRRPALAPRDCHLVCAPARLAMVGTAIERESRTRQVDLGRVSRVRLPRPMSSRYRGVRNRSWTHPSDCQRLGGTASDERRELAQANYGVNANDVVRQTFPGSTPQSTRKRFTNESLSRSTERHPLLAPSRGDQAGMQQIRPGDISKTTEQPNSGCDSRR
jgi:hypothetical protein